MQNRLVEIVDLAHSLAKPFEGLRLDAYFDPVGYPTQGYGRLLSRQIWGPLGHPPKNDKQRVTVQEWIKTKYPNIDVVTADLWLKQDMSKAINSAIRLCPGATKPTQIAALADFAFNCGAGNLEISSLRMKVNRNDFDGASDEFLKWVYARGVKLPGLVRRRAAEREMFLR